jgi:hypothetical protein
MDRSGMPQKPGAATFEGGPTRVQAIDGHLDQNFFWQKFRKSIDL